MNNRSLFLLLVGTIILFEFLVSYFLISDTLYFNNFAEQLSYEQIEELVVRGKKWKWIGYAITPVIYFFKLWLVTFCLSLGSFFADKKFSFQTFFNLLC
jgi:hypothetical protein